MMQIINLTPHELNILNADGNTVSVPPSGQVARVAQTREKRGSIDGITVTYSTFGDVEGLPDPQDGVIYVVSGLVLSAVPDRTDVFAPGEAVRDGEGRVIGARGLSCTPAYRGEYGALALDMTMAETLPRDDESARRLAALDADLAGQIRRQWIAKHGDVTHRVIDRESHATNPPGHKQAWTRGQRHHRREFGYED